MIYASHPTKLKMNYKNLQQENENFLKIKHKFIEQQSVKCDNCSKCIIQYTKLVICVKCKKGFYCSTDCQEQMQDIHNEQICYSLSKVINTPGFNDLMSVTPNIVQAFKKMTNGIVSSNNPQVLMFSEYPIEEYKSMFQNISQTMSVKLLQDKASSLCYHYYLVPRDNCLQMAEELNMNPNFITHILNNTKLFDTILPIIKLNITNDTITKYSISSLKLNKKYLF